MSAVDDPSVYLSCAFICRKLPSLLEYTHFVSSFVPNKIYRLIINRCLHWPREIYSFIFSAFRTHGLRVHSLYFVFNCPVLTVQLFIFVGHTYIYFSVAIPRDRNIRADLPTTFKSVKDSFLFFTFQQSIWFVNSWFSFFSPKIVQNSQLYNCNFSFV